MPRGTSLVNGRDVEMPADRRTCEKNYSKCLKFKKSVPSGFQLLHKSVWNPNCLGSKQLLTGAYFMRRVYIVSHITYK